MASTMARRSFLSISTWFLHPDIDMKDWEVLSRGSATLLLANDALSGALREGSNSRSTSNSRRGGGGSDGRPVPWNLIAAHHVTHPFRFPQYYGGEQYGFLEILEEQHVRHTLEVREEGSGRVLASTDLLAPIHGHPTRDCCLARLGPAHVARLMQAASAAGLDLQPMVLADEPAAEAAPLNFHGHFLQVSRDNETGEDTSVLLPRSIPGRMLLRAPHGKQVFARTREVLEMGMCGGPVTAVAAETAAREEDEGATAARHDPQPEVCLGAVEGIVPPLVGTAATAGDGGVTSSDDEASAPSSSGAPAADRAKRLLAGCAVFVECDEIQRFVSDVGSDAGFGSGGVMR